MKRFFTALSLFLVLLSVTACSHLQSASSTNLDRITQGGVLKIGTAANMPPLNMLNKNDQPMGLDVDLANYLAAAMGVELELVIKPFPELLPALEAGEVDMVISGLTITPERNLNVAFVGPYHVTGKALLTKFESIVAYENTGRLNSEALAFTALESSTSAELVEHLMPKSRLVTATNYEDAINLVLNDKVDALVADYHVCVVSLLRYPDQGLVSKITPFTYEPLGIAIPPGDAQLINWLNNFLHMMQASDELANLKAKWIKNPSWIKDLKK